MGASNPYVIAKLLFSVNFENNLSLTPIMVFLPYEKLNQLIINILGVQSFLSKDFCEVKSTPYISNTNGFLKLNSINNCRIVLSITMTQMSGNRKVLK